MNWMEKLNWRYATKRMTGESITEESLRKILEAIRLSASSLGFQPYTIYVVGSKEKKEEISIEACTQPQVRECSHFLVFAAWKRAGEKEINAYFENIAKTRNVTPESLADFRKTVENIVSSWSEKEFQEWASKQCYIALGFGLVACALEGVDSTPMEGFEPEVMNRVLGLEPKGQHAAVCMAIGKRDIKNDYLVNAKKVRRPFSELFVFL